MNRPLLKRMIARSAAWLAAAAVCTAVALAQQDAPATGQRTDGQIEMDVVHALDASAALKNDLITAATIQSQVTLSGTVSTDASKRLAESIVKGVPGVTGVKNNLKIGDPSTDPNAQSAQDQNQGDDNQDMADNQQQSAGAPMQDNGQNAPPPSYDPNNQNAQQQYPQQGPPPPQYGQQRPQYGQQPPPPGYAPDPGYGQAAPPPNYQQGYAPAPQPPSYRYAKGPVTVPQGTLIQVRTSESVDSKRVQSGEPIQFTVIQDVTFGGVLAIPRGATVHGVITDVKNVGSGTLTGNSEMALQLTALDLGGQSYPLESDQFRIKAPGKGGRSAGNIIGGALIGALIGGAAGGGGGAAIGAAAGGTVGTAASAASSGPRAWIPAEALVTFHLATAITINPVDPQEAMRLAQGLYPGGPSLYRRGGYYGGGPRAYPYPYYYAPVYYRPYYFSGGFYYWR